MNRFSPHSLRAGQVLSEDVYNLDSNLLFEAGTELTEKQIEIMMMWGVEKVGIKGQLDSSDRKDSPRFSNSAKSNAERLVKERFRLVKSSHPVVLALREIATLEIAKSLEPLNH